jgi:hypothetical protein
VIPSGNLYRYGANNTYTVAWALHMLPVFDQLAGRVQYVHTVYAFPWQMNDQTCGLKMPSTKFALIILRTFSYSSFLVFYTSHCPRNIAKIVFQYFKFFGSVVIYVNV